MPYCSVLIISHVISPVTNLQLYVLCQTAFRLQVNLHAIHPNCVQAILVKSVETLDSCKSVCVTLHACFVLGSQY